VLLAIAVLLIVTVVLPAKKLSFTSLPYQP